MCHCLKTLTSDNETRDKVNVNSSFVLGSISTGIGYSQVNELASTLNMPLMTLSTFNKYHEQVANYIRSSVWQKMREAAAEEAKFSTDSGDIDENGIPCITVVTDEAWGKRSYNVNYDSMSGVLEMSHNIADNCKLIWEAQSAIPIHTVLIRRGMVGEAFPTPFLMAVWGVEFEAAVVGGTLQISLTLLKKCKSTSERTVSYLFKTTYEEFIAIMGKQALRAIIDQINNNDVQYYSIIVDSIPDLAHIDQLAIV
ncbi:unnamed protein product [Ceutorhynchus assimilis]|uniref:Mutator-like transposase domain-containing protein n=1 Tax=Ceutorhynchus assimilis TaxID=467358 RepID=A0A9N9MYT4_9CUCU|nr:unnamed protein product [Ceutorhynchus assimilis]